MKKLLIPAAILLLGGIVLLVIPFHMQMTGLVLVLLGAVLGLYALLEPRLRKKRWLWVLAILACAGQKNLHGISGTCRENHMTDGAENALVRLLGLYGTPRTVMPKIRELAEEYGAGEMAAQLGRVVAGFTGGDLEDRIQIDFSATGDLRYYNGIAFKGFISGIPGSVLAGGQSDKLMRKMGRKDRAIGFAVFLDMLERLTEEETTRA